MDSSSQAGFDPDRLMWHLTTLAEEDPKATAQILGGLRDATELFFEDPSNPPWDDLYKWMMADTTGDNYATVLNIAMIVRPDDGELHQLLDEYERWKTAQEGDAADGTNQSTELDTEKTPSEREAPTLPHDEGVYEGADEESRPAFDIADISKTAPSEQKSGPKPPLDLAGLFEGAMMKGSPIQTDPTQDTPAQQAPNQEAPETGLYEALDLGELVYEMAVDDLLATYPDLHKNVVDALRLAEGLSIQTERPLDSVMLLIAIFAQASRGTLFGSARLVFDILEQQSYASTASLPEGVAQDWFLTPLAEDYGITSIPATYQGPTSHGLTAELLHVLDSAEALNGRATPPFKYVPGRIVLAVMLAPELAERPPAAQQYLIQRGFNVTPVAQALLGYIQEKDASNAGLLEALFGSAESSEGIQREMVFPSAGYRSDVVDPDAPDQLDIMPEVRAISRVLASGQARPPLSLGLFGDWGSGKSFFMAKMRKEIANIAFTARADSTPGFCSRIVQIEFNAWHFADANLWASLVSHIFGALFNELSGKAGTDEQAREKLKTELKQAEGLVQEANRALDEAAKEVEQAEDSLEEARKDREAQERMLHTRINDVASLLAQDVGIQARLKEAGEALGYPEATASYETLQQTAGELRSFSKRVSAIGQLFFQSPFTWVAIPFLVLVLLLPVFIDWLLAAYPGVFGWVNGTLAEIGVLVSGLAGWVGTQIKRLSPHLKAVEGAYEKAKAERAQRQQHELAEERRALDLAREREQAARDTLNAAQRRKQKIEHELSELSPDRQLYRLIEERSQNDRYSKHLGIISLIRKDFERMSKLLGDLTAASTAPDGEPPIQRIILYIDDLDRCRSERVVEVLEAIHLLLAFPLFVVVVGVDPRWLRRCLEAHYPDQLSGGPQKHRAATPEPDRAAVRASTPQDYLEKIFQIPFALRPISPDGYRDFIGELLKPLPEPAAASGEIQGEASSSPTPPQPPDEAPEAAPPGEHAAAESDEATAAVSLETPPQPSDGQSEAEEGGQAGEETETATRDDALALEDPVAAESDQEDDEGEGEQGPQRERVPLSPRQLRFTEPEERDIKRLAPLFRTPRAVKRFINIYRLLRVGLDPIELPAFEGTGTDENPGEYRAALVLLAVVTGFPNVAADFLQRFHDWLPEQNAPDVVPWQDFLSTLSPDALEQEGWAMLVNRLQRLQQGTTRPQEEPLPIPYDEEILDKWARRVARYSFSFNLRDALDA